MTIKYKHSYLSNGTKVKITEKLYQQLTVWKQTGQAVDHIFLDELKIQDNEWINKNRNYYIHNISLDKEFEKEHFDPTLLQDDVCIEQDVLNSEYTESLLQLLDHCTATQRRRFIKHYYLGYSYSQIATQEHCTKKAIGNSVNAVVKRIIDNK